MFPICASNHNLRTFSTYKIKHENANKLKSYSASSDTFYVYITANIAAK